MARPILFFVGLLLLSASAGAVDTMNPPAWLDEPGYSWGGNQYELGLTKFTFDMRWYMADKGKGTQPDPQNTMLASDITHSWDAQGRSSQRMTAYNFGSNLFGASRSVEREGSGQAGMTQEVENFQGFYARSWPAASKRVGIGLRAGKDSSQGVAKGMATLGVGAAQRVSDHLRLEASLLELGFVGEKFMTPRVGLAGMTKTTFGHKSGGGGGMFGSLGSTNYTFAMFGAADLSTYNVTESGYSFGLQLSHWALSTMGVRVATGSKFGRSPDSLSFSVLLGLLPHLWSLDYAVKLGPQEPTHLMIWSLP